MSYKLKTTTEFWMDFNEASAYIASKLKNRIAADNLLDELKKEANTLLTFPKASPPYASPPDTDTDYYALPVKNYLAFYVVKGNVIEFRRFLYSRSNIQERLKN